MIPDSQTKAAPLIEGAIHSVDEAANTVRIDPAVWSLMVVKQKQSVVVMLSRYFDERRGYKPVTVLSNHNDTRLAIYLPLSGCKILQ